MCLAFSGVIDSPCMYHLTKFDLNRMLVMDFGGLLNLAASVFVIVVVGVGKMRTADLVNGGS